MSYCAILLRLVLCLSLCVNATATAWAGARMPVALAMHAHARIAASSTKTTASPCHGHTGMATMGTMPMHPAVTASAHHRSSKTDQTVPDCCKSGLCDCACMQTLPVSVMLLVLPDAMNAHEPAVGAMALAHPSPTLAHPIRPPIG